MTESVETGPNVPTERTRLGGASALVAAVALVVSAGVEGPVAGLQGVAAAVVILAGWYLLPPTYAFALGTVALVAVLPETAVGRMVVVKAGLLGMLLAAATTVHDRGRSVSLDFAGEHLDLAGVLLVLAWALAGGALAWASARSDLGLPVAGVLLIALTAFVAYGLHRYQLVSLGLVSRDAKDGIGESARGKVGETSE